MLKKKPGDSPQLEVEVYKVEPAFGQTEEPQASKCSQGVHVQDRVYAGAYAGAPPVIATCKACHNLYVPQ